MTVSVRVLEKVTRVAPFGLRVWDFATATHLVEGLEIDVVAKKQPTQRVRAVMNRSGIYCSTGLPGMLRFELGDADDSAAYTAALRPYRIEIRDPLGRFLPMTFDAELPMRGLFDWLDPWPSPPHHVVLPIDHNSPPQFMFGRIPLFSAPTRLLSEPLATIRAQIVELDATRNASWCVITASIDNVVQGMGIADSEGRIAIHFPYPDRSRPVLASPPPAINDFRWSVELAAYYQPRAADTAPPEVPDLADLVAQFSVPQALFSSTLSPPQLLAALQLEYRVPLTVRTDVTASGPSSYLFVNTA